MAFSGAGADPFGGVAVEEGEEEGGRKGFNDLLNRRERNVLCV